jgi:hypothetical protein
VQGKQGTKHKAIKETIRIGAFLAIFIEFITIAFCAFAEEENFEARLAECSGVMNNSVRGVFDGQCSPIKPVLQSVQWGRVYSDNAPPLQ